MAAFQQLKDRRLPPYLRTILIQYQRHPYLKRLSEFYMSSLSRRHPCRLACLEYFSADQTPRPRELNMESLTQMLQNPQGKSEDLLGRMLIVEDLSPDVIELLGSSLEIDPIFFASHLHAARSEKTSKEPDVRLLPSTSKNLKFLSTIYHRPLTFATNPIPVRLRCNANVRRKVGHWPISKDMSVGLTQRCFSTTISILEDGTWLGIALVDPPVKKSFYVDERGEQGAEPTVEVPSEPFQGGYDDFMPARSHSDKGVHSSSRDSLFDDLIYYWTMELPFVFQPQAPTLLSLSYYSLKVIIAEWMNFANLMHYAVVNLEYSLEDLSITLSELYGLESHIRELQSWRRRSTDSIYKMRLLARAVDSLRSESPSSDTWESLLCDIEHVVNRIDIYSRRFDAVIPVLTSFIQVVESRRSFQETKIITRLTYLALIFVPLTFVSSLFSMSGDLAPGKQQFWIYFAVGIPLMAVVFLVARRSLECA